MIRLVISCPESASVLVLNDDPDMRSRLDRLLLLQGFTPIHASNAATAMAVADERHLDAFILDRRLLDGQPGLEVLAWLRRHPRYRLAPVFVLTGGPHFDDSDQALIKHHWAFVFYKGYSLHVLMEYINRVLDGLNRSRSAPQRTGA